MPPDRALLAMARSEMERDIAAHRRRRALWLEQLYAMEPRLPELDARIRNVFLDALSQLNPDAIQEASGLSLALQKEREELLRAMGASPEALEDTPLCSICGDTGTAGGQLCECLTDRLQALQAAELSSLLDLRGHCFASFNAGVFSDRYHDECGCSLREHMTATKQSCENYCHKFSQKSRNLLFSGPPGTGKTFLSSCVAGAIVERGFSVVYDTAVRLLSQTEALHFGRGDEDTERAVRRQRECDLLIIDDLGTEFLTPFTQSALLDIVNTRIISCKKMLVSTNLTREDIYKRYTPPLASRLAGEFLWLDFFGEDLRLR